MSSVNLDALRSIVKVRAVVPDNAFTAEMLGSERIGNGVVIGTQGLIATMGYLITEATDVWLTLPDGREVAGHALAYDQVTGFGLVVPLAEHRLSPLALGSAAAVAVSDRLQVLSHPDFAEGQTVEVLAKREFAGSWEYLLDTAIFTAPAHPHWSGAALVDDQGTLLGLGSLLVREMVGGTEANANMFVPIDLLKPILNDLMTRGRASRLPRPWLGIYAVQAADKVYVSGVAPGSPAQAANVAEGDIIAQIGDDEVISLPNFYRRLWSLGPAGVAVPLQIVRGGASIHLRLRSVDRSELLKRPQPN